MTLLMEPQVTPELVTRVGRELFRSLGESLIADRPAPILADAETIKAARAAAERKDILSWGKLLFPQKFNKPFCTEMHQYFVDIRMEEFTDTEAPRSHAKTTIKCFLIPTFQALEEPDLFNSYLNVQATEEKALQINVSIKTEIEENELLRAIYGNQAGERWTTGQFVLKNGVIFTGIGAGQSIRGLNYRNVRPDYIIVDDLYDDKDINNPESTAIKKSWFWSSLYPARAKTRRCSIHVQGTAINRSDLLEELKKHADVRCATFQAIKKDGTVLWPELNTRESLAADRQKMGSLIFEREYQNERRDDSTSIIKHAWLAAWEYDPVDLHRRIREAREIKLVGIMIGNDPSIGKKTENDFTGTALVLETRWVDGRGSEFWIEGLWNEKLSLVERIRQLEDINKARPDDMKVNRVAIEAIGGFNDYADEVIRKTNLPVKRVDHVVDKITNLENKSHFFENGKVRLNRNITPALKDLLIYQLTTNHPDHDDIRDAVLLTLEEKGKLWTAYA